MTDYSDTPRLVLSSCGTSILTNGAPMEITALIRRYANVRTAQDVPEPERNQLLAHIESQSAAFLAADIEQRRRLSAEFNALSRLQTENRAARERHILVCTDSWFGAETAEAVRRVLEDEGGQAEVWRIPDLRTDELEVFRVGMAELVRHCHEALPGWRRSGYRVVFNLTGGFKSIQGFLQTLAAFYADESIYVFESGNALLRLPRLPISLDPQPVFKRNLRVFRRLAANLPVSLEACEDIPDTLLFVVDKQPALSEWGALLWLTARDDLYARELQPSPSDHIRIACAVMDQANARGGQTFSLLNRRLDDLARYLELGEQPNLRSLDFKKLKLAQSGCTHEFDVSHNDGWRCFGRFEEEIFIIERLGPGLH